MLSVPEKVEQRKLFEESIDESEERRERALQAVHCGVKVIMALKEPRTERLNKPSHGKNRATIHWSAHNFIIST